MEEARRFVLFVLTADPSLNRRHNLHLYLFLLAAPFSTTDQEIILGCCGSVVKVPDPHASC